MASLTPRRNFIISSVKASVGLYIGSSMLASSCANAKAISGSLPLAYTGFTQEPIPYSYSALNAAIDAQTMEIHFTKHAATYATNLNDAAKAEGVDSKKPVEELLAKISKYSPKMRNNGGGHYNHEFFWKSMRASSDNNSPGGSLQKQISKDFGSFDAFKTQFADAGKNRFGSGWAWLVRTNDKKLVVSSTANQDNPLMNVSDVKGTPLLGLDVWEHAYYLKYQNRRPDYINAWWNVVNWAVVEKRFEQTK